MYIKYIFVLCLTYYLRTVNSIEPLDTKQIKNLWKAINDYSLENHISYDDLTRVYPDENPDELEALIDDYGFKCETDNDDSNDAIDFEGFKRAAFDGNIHRWTKQVMHNEFLAIIPEKEDRKYIILNDLIEYYESRILEPELKVIIEEYGIFEDKEYHLYVNGFRKALNIGLLPKPLCDESESLESVYTVYWTMLKDIDDGQINKRILMNYYLLEIDNIFEYYGDDRSGTGSRVFRFWNFRKAVTSGNLPLKMYKGNALQEVTPMRRLRSGTAAQLQIELKNLKKKVLDQEAIIKQLQQIKNLWKAISDYSLVNHISYDDLTRVYPDENPDELKALIHDYGFKCETDNDDSNDAIDFEGFKRAAFDGNIHRWTKQAMHNEFLAIIPEKEDRKYIILKDLIEYYESRILEPELKVIIEKYGIFEDEEYHLYVNDFRKALNIGLLPQPLCDESESLESVYTVYLKILKDNDDYEINKKMLMKYYSLEIDNIFAYYGEDRWGNGNRVLRFWNFRKAVTSGNLPLKMYKGNAFQEVTSMRRLRSGTAAPLQIEFKNLKKKVLDHEAIIEQLQVDIKQLQDKNLKRKVLDQEAIIEQLQKRPTLDGR